jgi:alpha-L-fucosidase
MPWTRLAKTKKIAFTIGAAVFFVGPACRTTPAVDHSLEPAPPAAAQNSDRPWTERPELEWWRRSMKTRDQRLAWWREARFGMFMHWGVYSELGGVWQGETVRGYAEHIQRIRKIPISVYRDKVAGQFNPTDFDADAWITAAQRAGMGYFIITAKHHDGFAMFDSAVSDYDVVDATPWKRDPMRALADACRRHGMRFGFYYSHAFDWGDAQAPGNDWDYENPGGDRGLHGGLEWWRTSPTLLTQVRRYVDGKAIPQIQELIRKYDPDILWFDTPHKLPPEENLRILKAVREAKPDIVVNGRMVQVIPGGPEARFGDFMDTADRPAELTSPEGDWEAIPTTNESYGYHRMDDSHKPPSHFVQLLAKAAARGGNLLLNVGPRGDGRIDPKDMAILDGIAHWMSTNLESIRGTTRTPLPVQSWGQSTVKGSRLYLHVFEWPTSGRLRVAGLQTEVVRGYLLGDTSRSPLAVTRRDPLDVEVQLPTSAPDPWDSVVVLECDGAIRGDRARLVAADATTSLHVFDGRLIGSGIRTADGKRDRDVVMGWNVVDSGIEWRIRADESARYSVRARYTSGEAGDGGSCVLAADDKVLTTVTVTPSAGAFTTAELGEVSLAAGAATLSIRAKQVSGAELMRLQRIELVPVR